MGFHCFSPLSYRVWLELCNKLQRVVYVHANTHVFLLFLLYGEVTSLTLCLGNRVNQRESLEFFKASFISVSGYCQVTTTVHRAHTCKLLLSKTDVGASSRYTVVSFRSLTYNYLGFHNCENFSYCTELKTLLIDLL